MNFKKSREPKPLKKGNYTVDVFNKNPLFAVKKNKDAKLCVVSSWEESFTLLEEVCFEDINPKYLMALIRNQISTEISPYLNIKRIPRSHNINLQENGDIELFKYEPFQNSYYGTKEADLHKKINTYLLEYLYSINDISSKKIGCEHSSGQDSNAILGALRFGLNITRNNPMKPIVFQSRVSISRFCTNCACRSWSNKDETKFLTIQHGLLVIQ